MKVFNAQDTKEAVYSYEWERSPGSAFDTIKYETHIAVTKNTSIKVWESLPDSPMSNFMQSGTEEA